MKLLWILGLIISITGYGDVPAEGLELTITEAEEDILSGEMQINLEGTLLCNEPLSVTITRSATELKDEFCCAGQCTAGNGELSETLHFTPNGLATWFSHYTPVAGSNETIIYRFDDGIETQTITVHYNYSAQGVETVTGNPSTVTHKILHNGQLLIQQNDKTYTPNGTIIN